MSTGRRGTARRAAAGPAVDEDELAQLLDDLGAESFEEVCAVFVRDAHHRVQALRTSMERHDPEAVARAAHAMKSASGFVGAHALARLCAQIDHLARTNRLDEARACAHRLAEETERACDSLALVVPRLMRPPTGARKRRSSDGAPRGHGT